ncbi:MAG: winged helix-turn-helix transcriptional regulator [Thermoplasmata archaeon]|nr:winged helix-turn-helix transcriptional regulator [Thermoplasmata archaeon]
MDIRKTALWVIDVDRRLITLKTFRKTTVLHPSDISKEVGRSTQNISHALHEMEEKGIVESIDEKSTWKKYMLTEIGKKILKEVEKILDPDE